MKCRLPLTDKELESAAGEICSSIDQKKWLVSSLKLVMKQVAEQKKMHGRVYFPSIQRPQLVKTILIGEAYVCQKRQRRRIKHLFPAKGVGNPELLFADYLMIKLGELYVRITGENPTSGGIKGAHSRFKRFATPFFEAFGIGNFRNRVRRYIAWRQDHKI